MPCCLASSSMAAICDCSLARRVSRGLTYWSTTSRTVPLELLACRIWTSTSASSERNGASRPRKESTLVSSEEGEDENGSEELRLELPEERESPTTETSPLIVETSSLLQTFFDFFLSPGCPFSTAESLEASVFGTAGAAWDGVGGAG